ncbi:prolyl oligopeptidase family serine peptidase [Nocardia sp. CA-135398]|uniref:prolyl oligopeptidase family serine peptidase n=1 Tax=Nocardia sp. CA-135398 TaxID=3239977 RepID=UPI003D987CC8
MTIAGECLDLQAAVTAVRERFAGQRMSIVAASFGAVSTALSLSWLDDLYRLVLWNPVLDLRRTFLVPELAWGEQNFGAVGQKGLADNGFLLVDGEFQLGRVLFTEFAHYQPLDDFRAADVPTLIVHRDHDTVVSYDVAAQAARSRSHTTLHTIAGSDPRIRLPAREDEAISTTVDWLLEQTMS